MSQEVTIVVNDYPVQQETGRKSFISVRLTVVQ